MGHDKNEAYKIRLALKSVDDLATWCECLIIRVLRQWMSDHMSIKRVNVWS